MKIFLSLALVFFVSALRAECSLKTKVISLSGGTTVLFKELGLLNKLSGISVFSPVKKNEFSGTIYPGGVFLSQKSLSEFSDTVVFYDESQELTKALSQNPRIQKKEIKTRNLLPLEALEVSIKAVTPVINQCEKEISFVREKAKKLQGKILRKFSRPLSVIFYLGELKQTKFPELVIVQDGVVKFLLQEKKIHSYPSDLAYVNWSSKIIQNFPVGTLHVGIKDPGMEDLQEVKKLSDTKMTLIYPGSLVPGITQLEAILFWADRVTN